VGSRTLRVLSPLFRYSAARDAWVLRLVGRRVGPALTTESPDPLTMRANRRG
jgi:hypothetical protein